MRPTHARGKQSGRSLVEAKADCVTERDIDIRGALSRWLIISSCGGKCGGTVRSRSFCHAHLITRMNAQLLFEGGSYFSGLAKRAEGGRGAATIQVIIHGT